MSLLTDKLVNPSQLVEGVFVSWSKVNDPTKPPAFAKRGRVSYEAVVNDWWLDQVRPDERRLFDYCLRLHEIAHARYKTFAGGPLRHELQRWLFNLVEDVRIEYRLMMEFPSLVPYFRALFGFMSEELQPVIASAAPVTNGALRDCNVLLKHLRQGKLAPDNWLVRFTEPRLEVVQRGAVGGSRLLSAQLFSLIVQTSQAMANPKIIKSKAIVMGAKTKDDLTPVRARTQEEQGLIEAAEQAMEESQDRREVDEICDAGPGNKTITEQFVLERDPRWQDVVVNNMGGIVAVQQALRRIYTRVVLRDAKRGDLSVAPHRMQQAYVDSYGDGEVTAPYYRVFHREEHKADVLLLLDQSDSIGQEGAQVIADAAIATAAAVEGVKAVRIAVAGFGKGDGTTLMKEFASPAWAGDYTPITDGGTPMGQCMLDVAGIDAYLWRRDSKHIAVFLTDGMPDNWSTVQEALLLDYYKNAILVPIVIGQQHPQVIRNYAITFEREPVHIATVEEAAQAIAQVIMESAGPWTRMRVTA